MTKPAELAILCPMRPLEERLLRAAFVKTPEPAVVVDGDGTVRFWSDGAGSLLGYGAAEMIGQPLSAVFLQPQECTALLAMTGRTGQIEGYRAWLQHKDGSRLRAVAEAAPLDDLAPTAFRVIFSTTEESADFPSGAQLLRLQRFCTLGQMVAGLAHDLRSPLHVAASITETALSKGPGAVAGREELELIARNVRHAAGAVAAVLEFSRTGALRLRPGSVAVVMGEALALLDKRRQSQTVSLHKRLGRLPDIPIDAQHLRGAFYNILSNALDAMPDGGKLGISTGTGKDGAWLCVSDTGAGMSSDIISRAGEPFLTTKTSGIGLGLHVTRLILKEHGADISFRSQPGKGTQVRVRFPAASK